MKLPLLFCCIALGLVGTLKSNAQNGFNFGVLAGANYASYEYVGDKEIYAEYDSGFGYYIGGFVSIPIGVKLTFAPELLFSYQTAKADGDIDDLLALMDLTIPFNLEGDVNLDATEKIIMLPLMFRMKVTKFDFALGPQISYSLSRKLNGNAEIFGFDLDLDDVDVADLYDEKDSDNFGLNMNIDAGYYITEHLKIGARYSYGVLVRDEMRTSVVQLGLSYGIL
ncbi:hypothetical protein NBRC110019_06270 [Neptunitalea chrysea]|uniref:Outer membrane protein beta-barrel domain-containing protein n=1 Tax=Neptunitalea chrysea TaxID=1647581 RepID=A0A9W6B329_9FLAO|nr:porin family protein [Neptunitalea chrysea]GLB51588.1 hypothetical protein NBRC110019_06270 [Neptunitalea chrysea]